jgi:hypothetical protein
LTGTDARNVWRLTTVCVVVAVGGACGGTGPVEVRTVASAPVTPVTAVATSSTCSVPGAGYTLTYPSGWYTVEEGPVPCRFFHPEPFVLPERTEASWIAVNVQLAPVAFDEIVRVETTRLAAATVSRREVDLSGRRAVRTVVAVPSGDGLLPRGVRVATWYVDYGKATLVGTTTQSASAGTFHSNAQVLDGIIASAASSMPAGDDLR